MLYDLVRNGCCLIMISNSRCMLAEIDQRIRSSLFLKEIEFRPYSRQETCAIIRERVIQGIASGWISDELLTTVAESCRGDARVGLHILMAASRLAESKGLQRLTSEEIRKVSESARKYRLSYLLSKLNKHQRAVYAILKKVRSMKSGDLYTEYFRSVKKPVVDRAYRKHMERMEELGLVKSEGSGRWKRYEAV